MPKPQVHFHSSSYDDSCASPVFKQSHISSVPSSLLSLHNHFVRQKKNPGQNGLRGAQVEAQTLKHSAAVSRSLSEQFVSSAFSNTFTFLMEGVLFLCSGGLAYISLIVSVCFAAAEPLFTATSLSNNTNNGANTSVKITRLAQVVLKTI